MSRAWAVLGAVALATMALVVVVSWPSPSPGTEADFAVASDAPTIDPTESPYETDETDSLETKSPAQTSSAGILLLATPEDGRFVRVDVYASDASAEVTVRRISESGGEVTVGTYTGETTFEDGPLPSGRYLYEASAEIDGSKITVYSPIADVFEDTTPPHAWMELAGRAHVTNNPSVRALIGGLSEPVTDMRFALSEDELDAAAWQPFEAHSNVELGSGDRVYRIFAQVRDSSGLESPVMSGQIQLDTVLPESVARPLPATTESAAVGVPFVASDAATFVNYVEVWLRHRAEGAPDWGRWTMVAVAPVSPADVSLPFGEGEYEFYTVAFDHAGNREAPPARADAATVYRRAD